jgi:nifR3 family TIM-barrel protein
MLISFLQMKNVWEKVIKNKPFFCLAPMADVSDAPFRQIIAKYSRHGKIGGGPDVFWTEFVSEDALASEKGRKKLLHILKYSKKEKPIIAQIFGANPQNIEKACKIIAKLGFDGIDINMGCPDKKVEKQGAGSALMKNPVLAREIIRSAKKGAGKLPVSVKTRLGYNTFEYKTWLPEILKENISALTIHLRTRKEMSKVPAHWEIAKDIVKVVRECDKKVVLIANGDIQNIEEGNKNAKKAGFDGVMIGRGIFGNPWLFDTKRKTPVSIKEKLSALLEHTKLFNKIMLQNQNKFSSEKKLERTSKHFDVMKKHFKAYVNGFDGAKELRIKLMQTKDVDDVKKIINSFLLRI